MVTESFSFLHFLPVFLYAFLLQLLFFAFLKIDAAFIDGQDLLATASQDIRNFFKTFDLLLFLFGHLLFEPVITLIYSSLCPREKLFEGWRHLLILNILVYLDIAFHSMGFLKLVIVICQFLLLLVKLLLLLSARWIVDRLVLLIKDLVDQFFSLLFDWEMMRLFFGEVFLVLLSELQDIHFIYIFIPLHYIFKWARKNPRVRASRSKKIKKRLKNRLKTPSPRSPKTIKLTISQRNLSTRHRKYQRRKKTINQKKEKPLILIWTFPRIISQIF